MSVPVRPLHCSHCGAALALGPGATTRCPYCQTETPIPEEYRAVQRAAQGFAADRRLAEQLYHDVGQPPGWLLRTWARTVEGSAGVGSMVGMTLLSLLVNEPLIGLGLILAAAYAIGYPVAAVWHLGQRLLKHPVTPLSPIVVLPVAALCVVLLVGVPVVLLSRERVLATVRRDIHASLAAKPPQQPGGPSLCHGCGAALEVPEGALGVPCPYCRADNLVALPTGWVAEIQRSEFHHFLSIDAALEAFRSSSRAATERLWMLVFGLILVLPLIFGLAYLLTAATVRF